MSRWLSDCLKKRLRPTWHSRQICILNLDMKHLVKLSLLTLLSISDLCLSSDFRYRDSALSTSGRSDELLSITSIPSHDPRKVNPSSFGASTYTSSHTVTTSSSRRNLSLHPLPRETVTSLTTTEGRLEGNGGYRAAAYYVNWVSYPTLRLLCRHR